MKDNLFCERIKAGDINIYIQKMLEGDNNAREKIISHYICVLNDIIEQKYTKEKDELLSASIVGIVKAVNRYRFSMGCHLSTLVFSYSKKEIDKYLKVYKNDNNLRNLWEDNAVNVMDYYEEQEEYEKLNHCIDLLSGYDGIVIRLYFGIGCKQEYTQKEIANILSLSTSRVNAILNRGVERLKNILEAEPIIKAKRGTMVKKFFSLFEGYTSEEVKAAMLKVDVSNISQIKYLYNIEYDEAIKKWNSLDETSKIVICKTIDEIRIELKKSKKEKTINLSKY